MSEPRPILIVAGSRDDTGVGILALETAAKLAADRILAPVVYGVHGPLLHAASSLGLSTVDLTGLAQSERRRWIATCTSGAVHLVHALGFEVADSIRSSGAAGLLPLVVTADASRPNRSLPPWRHYDRGNTPVRWLVHGSTATTRLVQSGATPGDEVMTLPLLGFFGSADADWSAARAAARRLLSLTPGARVVVGVGPLGSPALRYLEDAAARPTRRAIVGIWINTGPAKTARGRRARWVTVVESTDGRRLLPAMDVLLADGTTLAARHPAVDAVRAGVPVVTTPTDVAAGLVLQSVNGYVCSPGEFGAAIGAAVAMAVARTLPRHPLDRMGRDPLIDTAEVTARCYSSILGRPLLRPLLIGRRAAG
ncbi:MAG: hypothetical protein QOJ62_138 [Actinomycetota bacterium]|jgi:NAD(P)H-hydrate repair Nnr-like enzyme with NAD(P)H-hydrate dehydratase domain|nr:hypothetical protein [Actinomycetota bacterium]